jgi:hypothetical protein
MRTKTLLIATAAALAAGIISSQAQTVYSQNIVGYVNSPLTKGYVNVANPLDLSAGNSLTNVLQNPVVGGPGGPNGGSGPLDFTTVLIWNGTGYNSYTLDTDYPTGVANGTDSAGVTPPIVNPGTLIYFNNNTGNVLTNTIVGTVHVDFAATGTNVIGITTNILLTGYNFVASKLPVAGGIESVLEITNSVPGGNGGPNGGNGPLDFATILIPNINGAGTFLGYTTVTFDTDYATGFANGTDSAAVAEPQIPVGTGVIINNNTGHTYTWTQSY